MDTISKLYCEMKVNVAMEPQVKRLTQELADDCIAQEESVIESHAIKDGDAASKVSEKQVPALT